MGRNAGHNVSDNSQISFRPWRNHQLVSYMFNVQMLPHFGLKVTYLSRDGRFGFKVGQIGPKWDKSRSDFSFLVEPK